MELTLNPAWEAAELEECILIPKASAYVAPAHFEKRPAFASQPDMEVYFDPFMGKRYDAEQNEIPKYLLKKHP
jgi:hypothetical protein